MDAQLSHIIVMVDDMDRAVAHYRDVLGLPVKFASPEWSEFATGSTSLAVHPSSERNPAGHVELGITVANLDAFYAEMSAKGVHFPMPPTQQPHGKLAQFVDANGVLWSASEG